MERATFHGFFGIVPDDAQGLPYDYMNDTLPDDASPVMRSEREERDLYAMALSPLIAWAADPEGGILDIDERGLDRFGLTVEEARAKGFLSVVHPQDRSRLSRIWRQNAPLGQSIDNELRLRLYDGSYRWHRSRAAPRYNAQGAIMRWYGTIEDIHDRKLAEDALRWTAAHDGLTGLCNRRHFQEYLGHALARSERRGSQVALLLLDVDNFKGINDQFGHHVGDVLLQAIAGRLQGFAGKSTTAGRLGGDEFALFLARPDLDELRSVVADVLARLNEPIHSDDQAVECRVSIGVSIYPAHGLDVATLTKNADLALYDAKARGGGICYFESRMRARTQLRQSMLSVARDALLEDNITAFYQPKINLQSGRIAGFEALLRWRLHGGGWQAPAAIAAAFDDAELALAIGERMRTCVFDDIGCWQRDGIGFGRISVNVTSAEFRQASFAEDLLAELRRRSISTGCVEVEITESVFIDRDRDHTSHMLECLSAAGVAIALDDFGTGYASLAHLKCFPVDVLKIDKSFVERLSDARDRSIVRAMIGLGRSLNITTVAEGVETEDQAERLYRKGCDLGQGFLFSEAIPAGQVPELLGRTWPRRMSNDRRLDDRRSGKAGDRP